MFQVEHLEACASTQAEARRRAREGAPDGTVVVAKRQDQGHGRYDRPWHSPDGGLYLSMVLRDVEDPGLVTLALGNAVADALEVVGVEPRLKWVNDVLVEDRKVAGVLVEGESTGQRIDFLVAGIGINVNGEPAAFPAPLDKEATTLEREVGADQCVPDLEDVVLEHVERWVARVRGGRRDEVLEAWRARDALQGRRVRVEPLGEDAVEGVARGVDGQGHLVVDTAEGRRTFEAATVRLA